MGNKLGKSKQSTNNNNFVSNVNESNIAQQDLYMNSNFNVESNNLGFGNNNLSVQKTRGSHEGDYSITRLNTKAEDQKKQTVAVIVTFQSCGTYDSLFSSVQQKAQEGTKVVVYQCSCQAFQQIQKAFDGTYANDTYKQLITEINKVDPDCVVFNWECCGQYGNSTFREGANDLLKFVRKMINKKFLCMFSDFSLKALINDWKIDILGPNPFVKTGETSDTVELRFKSGELKQCPSAQLQTVGQMAEDGKVNVHTMGGTIVYSINKKNLNHNEYQLQLLTVVNNIKAKSDDLKCEIGEFNGNAGHVLLKYPSGGAILTSMTHWIELMKVDTSQQKLFEVAARQYGESYAQKQRNYYENLDECEKVNWRAQKATEFIQNQAPCTNMKRKARY